MRTPWTVAILTALVVLGSTAIASRAEAQTPVVVTTATPGGVATVTPGLLTTATPSSVGTVSPLTGTSGTAPLSSAQQQNLPLTATLIGAAEVPGPGDPDAVGSAAVTLDPSTGTVCYALHVVNIATPATAAHIHEGAVDQAGPIVIPLTAPTGGDASGCAQGVESSVLRRLMDDPRGFYVNVHNPDYPDGAARGQLGR
jgi:hypothetical protein